MSALVNELRDDRVAIRAVHTYSIFFAIQMRAIKIIICFSAQIRVILHLFRSSFLPNFLIDHTSVYNRRNTTSTLPKTNRNLFMFRRLGQSSPRARFGRRQDLPLRSRFCGYQKQFCGLSLSLSCSFSLLLPLFFNPAVSISPSSFFLSPCLSRASSPPSRFRSQGNLQELLEMDRPAGWKPRTDFTRGIYANNRRNYVSAGPHHGSSAHNQREK